ncbi:hypothetical protein MIND_00152700 [Mycena indigotica]|uniref:Fungal-type protein kinase domain-containing protein n=1 Tax=Mycena indigotica TaxID=2126181 RepID=A0A8H6TFK2_9AGAR|nr:uncharacterized protein MIND_00152700 [Mycena indigotica]KAF7316339.1 hypothetical protein MIND_00152700 [Mycena indigotica]
MTRSRSTQSDCSSPPVTQDDLKSVLEHEIRNHVWEFSPMRFATRVCQRTRKTSADVLEVKQRMEIADDIDRADYYDLAVDEPAFQEVFEKCRKDLDTSTFISRFQAAKGGIEGKQDCTPLVEFLNACLALVKSKCPDLAETSIYSKLEFLVYDRPTQDGIEGEKSLKPDIVGVSPPDSQSGEDWRNKRFYWCPPSATEPLPPNAADIQIGIPLEVQDEWPELLRQAATYGHALFAANPLRVYALVLACNPVEWDFRFLLFHRGGLSCSKPLSLVTQRGQEEMLWIWMALLTCKTVGDIGLPPWYNGVEMLLPVGGGNAKSLHANIEEVLHSAMCCRGRATNVFKLSYPNKRPVADLAPIATARRPQTPASTVSDTKSGASDILANKEDVIDQPVTAEKKIRPKIAQYPLGELKMASKVFTKPLSTSEEEKQVILKSIWDRDNPTWKNIEDELASACDELFGCPGHHYSCTPADETSGPFTNHLLLPTPEEAMDLQQFHWSVFSKTVPSEPEWRSQLYHLFDTIGSSLVSSPNPLALFVAILHTLLGWLAMFQLGYFHRDPSIGNLLRLAEAVAMKKFEIDLRLAPDAIDDLIAQFRHLGLSPSGGSQIDCRQQAQRVKDLLETLGVGSDASGLIIDGDNAVKWHHFDAPRNSTRSGTVEFMSDLLLHDIQAGKGHLYSPVDDLRAVFYVCQWAAVFRDKVKLSHLTLLRQQLGTNRRATATRHIQQEIRDDDFQLYGKFLPPCVSFLSAWNTRLVALGKDFKDAQKASGGNNDLLRLMFLSFAYRGVADFMEVFLEWKQKNNMT